MKYQVGKLQFIKHEIKLETTHYRRHVHFPKLKYLVDITYDNIFKLSGIIMYILNNLNNIIILLDEFFQDYDTENLYNRINDAKDYIEMLLEKFAEYRIIVDNLKKWVSKYDAKH